MIEESMEDDRVMIGGCSLRMIRVMFKGWLQG
jgi:hypothetical protein